VALDYRSEIKRPVSLALVALAVLGWIVAGVVVIQQTRKAHERRHEIRQLTISQSSARAEAEQLRRANGDLAALQSRMAAAQQQASRAEQASTEAEAQAAPVKQALQKQQQAAAEAAKAADDEAKRLAELRREAQAIESR